MNSLLRTALLAVLLALPVTAFTLTAPAATPTACAQDFKLGYVDLQRLLEETEDGKKARRRLKAMFNKRQKKLDKAQEDMVKMKKETEDLLKSPDVPQAQKQEKMMAYQKALMELQNMFMNSQKEMAKAEEKALSKIMKKARGLVREIGSEGKYDIVLEKSQSAILWAPKSLDMTDILIQKYNAAK